MAPSSSPALKRPIAALRILLVTVLLLGVALTGRLWLFPPASQPTPPTQPVVIGSIEDTVLATGKLEASKLVSVGAQVSGQIKLLHVSLGQVVKKGQPIAEIDRLTQENALHRAEASERDSRAQRHAKEALLKQVKLAHERQMRLAAADATSREDLESAEASLRSVEAEIAQIDAQIDQAVIAVDSARVDLGYTRITAPMDGTVVAVVAQEGQTVNANQTTPTIVKLAQLDKMTVKAEISEADVTRVKPGQEVYFTILGDPRTRYLARLASIKPAPASISEDGASTTGTSSSSSSSSSSSGSTSSAIYYEGLFDVPNPDGRLRISMTAKVSIVLARAEKTLLVAASAFDDPAPDGASMVRVVEEDGRIRPRRVLIGITDNVMAQVLDGLTVGEQVVTGEPPKPKSQSQQGGMRPPPPGPMGF